MKSSYTVPKLTVHGNVADITQVNGTSSRQDFTFLNGQLTSNSDDLGSKDICAGSPDPSRTPINTPTNCDSRF